MAEPAADFEKGEPAPVGQVPHEVPKEKQVLQLQFEPGDPEDPRNFGFWRKIWFTFVVSMLSFLGLFATSVVAPAEPELSQYVHTSIEVTTLLAALYILGTQQESSIVSTLLLPSDRFCTRSSHLGST